MLIVKSLHLISMVAWFAGLFYLPRLFVYHTDANDIISIERFKVMERRLYYGIIWPAGVLTTIFGLALLSYQPEYYLKAAWMHAKLMFVALVWTYHLHCGRLLHLFQRDKNKHSARFYRFFNELPTVLLIVIVFLVELKP